MGCIITKTFTREVVVAEAPSCKSDCCAKRSCCCHRKIKGYVSCGFQIIAYVVALMLLIIVVVVIRKEHRKYDRDPESVASLKIYGVAYTDLAAMFNITVIEPRQDIVNRRVWDVADFVVPPQQTQGSFVMTNMIITPNQTQERCGENPMIHTCLTDRDCPEGTTTEKGNGVRTGKCIKSTMNSTVNVCEIFAWCPVEERRLPVKGEAVLQESSNFTLLIKNGVFFSELGVSTRNIANNFDVDDVTEDTTDDLSCFYNESDSRNRTCPRFTLGQIVKLAGLDYNNIAVRGGIIAIFIHWDCDLGQDISLCQPKYSFKRTDNENSSVEQGLSFRFAHYFLEAERETRTLVRAYGIGFRVLVTGVAYRFDFGEMFWSGAKYLAYFSHISIAVWVLDKILFCNDDDLRKAREEEVLLERKKTKMASETEMQQTTSS